MATNNSKYKFMLLKYYFDLGLSFTSYLKYVLVAFGLASRNVRDTLIVSFIYAVVCFLLGRHAYKHGWIRAARAIENKKNPELLEILRLLKKRKV